ncbi:cytoplasmic protein [Rhizoctonia solani AG-1 IA]|uniref:Cytoplasmic protein n=1 Tax=Thanatephorus cucumeris (strain AG1-IA) TaxID=983506 RepID=L8X6B6_THACA|nr:cytoplasmic protein [Rhizoctonia solani AG-1 IA]
MSSNSNSSNNRRGRGGRRGGRGGRGNNATSNGTVRSSPAAPNGSANSNKAAPTPDTTSADSDEMICWICAEPVKFYALSECNHRTCHVCALRLRALYKRTDCTFLSVIFTTSATKGYSDFTPNDIPFSDPKLQISFETKEMMEDTMILLRFNCPDADCDVIAQGWGDLKWHVKEKHDSILCDLCIRHKKIFAHEHTLYSPVTFSLHMPSVHTRRFSAQEKANASLPDIVHPMCQFCRECSFGDDELFAHLREHHEECFVCNFRNYEQLEQHFKERHYPCTHPTCLEQKFVVFATQLDLQGHQVDVHGEQMSSRDRRDARRVDLAFSSGTRGGRGRGGRVQVNETTESRAREPPAQATTQPPPQPGPPPGRGSRRAAFGASLTVGGPSAQNGSPASQQGPPRPPPSRTPDPDVDPETLEQHNQFLSLLDLYASTNGATAIRGAIRSYKSNESSAKDMLTTIRTVLDDNMNAMSTLVNGLVPLFDEEKRGDILNAWNGMKIEQRDQFPSLTPTSLGSGFADIASGRVLNVKHSTRSSGSRAGSSSRSTGAVWDRVERVAAGLGGPTPALQSSAAPKPIKPNPFPPLGGGAGGGTSRSGASSSSTPWSGSATTQSSQHIIIAPARAPEPVKNNAGRPPPITSSSAFPELPSSSASRAAIPKMSGNQSLKRITGESPALGSVWGGGSENNTPTIEEPAPATNAGGKGKKKKGKETLFTLGSFPN